MIRRVYVKRLRIWRGYTLLWLLHVEGRIAKRLRIRGVYFRHLAKLVQRTGLFDDAHYLEANPDVDQEQVDPNLHYVRFGDREGRQPMPLFDPSYYRTLAADWLTGANSLLHYCYVGRFLGVSPSAWFDVEFYDRENRDVARSGGDPLLHYLESGGLEGRSPCRQFDAAFYLRGNPDVWHARVNPLVHYLKFGRIEGRPISASGTAAPEIQTATPYLMPLLPENWDDVNAHSDIAMARVDVVVPVFRGTQETLRCLRSVLLSTNQTPFSLIVINDGSPDAGLVAALQRHADRGLFTLLHNAANVGFVVTANRGMSLHADRDVVLLNADTEVYGDWLDRLMAAAYRNPMTATVTPLSNNATIASYPCFQHDNPYPLELSFAELDGLTSTVNEGSESEAPTGVGFCMYIRRDCLDDIGDFDAAAFGRGYGEENDFCQRAIANGWRNIIAANVFVHHLGSVSFQGERAKAIAKAMQVMVRRHPDYLADVASYVELDPLQEARSNLDWARLRSMRCASNTLIVCHNRGGGAERHVREDADRLRAEGKGVFFLRPVPGQAQRVRISHPDNLQLPNLPSFELSDIDALGSALQVLHINHIHNHGMVDFTADAPDQLVRLAKATGATLDVDIHDYQVICPRINLADESGRYCGEPAEKACDACLANQGNKYGARSIRAWRHSHERMLQSAETVWVPDEDVSERLRRYYPGINIAVAPHEDMDPIALNISPTVVSAAEPLRVTVIGAIGKIKGYDVLLACARDAQQRRLPLRFSLLGYSMNDQTLIQAGVAVTGRYLEQQAHDKLRAIAPHAVWLPSLWPETYSYTLSLALQCGFPVYAFDIGAIARRLRENGLEKNLFPLSSQYNPRSLNSRFLELA